MASFPQRRPKLPVDLSQSATAQRLGVLDSEVISASWVTLAASVVAVVSIAAGVASATWTVPAPTVQSPVSISAGVAEADWVVPAASVGGTQSVNADVASASWTVPAPTANLSIGGVDVASITWTIPAASVTSPVSVGSGAASATWVIPASISPQNLLVSAVVATWGVFASDVSGGTAAAGPAGGAISAVIGGGMRVIQKVHLQLHKRMAGGLGPRQWVWRDKP